MQSLIHSLLIVAKLAHALNGSPLEDERPRFFEEPKMVVVAVEPLTGGYRRPRAH